MTSAARWLLAIALLGLGSGVWFGQMGLALLSLASFIWVLVEWLRFQACIHFQLPGLRLERLVNGRPDSTGTLWAGRRVRIEVRLHSRRPLNPILHLYDLVPEILEVLPERAAVGPSGEPAARSAGEGTRPSPARRVADPKRHWGTRLRAWLPAAVAAAPSGVAGEPSPNCRALTSRSQPQGFAYIVSGRAAGRVTLPGVRVTVRDSMGFFAVHRFIGLSQTFRILPDYLQAAELRPTIKRQNSLPQHGIHRLKRAGMGAELLELREYVAGDPPKAIAWKVSARRDTLMTRQYESEVPVRVQLFIDGSLSTRMGGYGLRLLDQINRVAASVAQAAISVGDPIRGTLVEDGRLQRLPLLSGDQGFLRFLQALADFSQRPPPRAEFPTDAMVRTAMSLCHERYPELLDDGYQRIPFSFYRRTRERYRLAGVLAEVYQLSPRQQAECYYDNRQWAHYLQRLLYDAGMPWMAPLFSVVPDPLAAGGLSTQRLVEAIGRAMAHARDNEVLVILADLQSCAANLQQWVPVVKLALAKHHRVAFVCPTTTF
ncbi:MAG: DUF58 domain-containing protein, partial [Planctomycetales bacterium]|nr:DUF58 domain-containing protein [Planctomycetales bacterium]